MTNPSASSRSITFSKRAGTTSKGGEYEYLLTAYLAFEFAVDTECKEFYITSNDKDYGSFNDIVITFPSNDPPTTYAIQLKHRSRQITKNALAGLKGDLSIQKYFQSYKDLIKNHNFKDLICVLYTNAEFHCCEFKIDSKEHVEVSCIEQKLTTNEAKLLNTSDNDHVYQFKVNLNSPDTDDTEKKEINDYKTFFKNFYLYTNQKDVDQLDVSFQQSFEKKLFKNEEAFNNYNSFIKKWDKVEDRKDALTENVIITKIAEFFLNPYITSGVLNEKLNLFQKACQHCDITFVTSADASIDGLFSDDIKPSNNTEQILKLQIIFT